MHANSLKRGICYRKSSQVCINEKLALLDVVHYVANFWYFGFDALQHCDCKSIWTGIKDLLDGKINILLSAIYMYAL